MKKLEIKLNKLASKLKRSRDIEAELRSLGFVDGASNGEGTFDVYLNKRINVIAKRNALFIFKKPMNAVTTVLFSNDGHWCLQPKVRLLSDKERKRYDRKGYEGDCHSGNVGYYGGKLVAFDW